MPDGRGRASRRGRPKCRAGASGANVTGGRLATHGRSVCPQVKTHYGAAVRSGALPEGTRDPSAVRGRVSAERGRGPATCPRGPATAQRGAPPRPEAPSRRATPATPGRSECPVAALAHPRLERDLPEQRYRARRACASASRPRSAHRRCRRRPCAQPSGSSIHDMFSTTPTSRWRVCSAIEPGPLGHLGGRLLRGGDHQQLGVRDQLGSRDRDVAGARGKVEQQDVQVAPEDVGEELVAARGAASGRARPRRRCPAVNMPMEMTFSPCACGGMIMSSTRVGRAVIPSIRGTEWP